MRYSKLEESGEVSAPVEKLSMAEVKIAVESWKSHKVARSSWDATWLSVKEA